MWGTVKVSFKCHRNLRMCSILLMIVLATVLMPNTTYLMAAPSAGSVEMDTGLLNLGALSVTLKPNMGISRSLWILRAEVEVKIQGLNLKENNHTSLKSSLKDEIITVLGDFSKSELSNIKTRDSIKQTLIARINNNLFQGKTVVSDLYFRNILFLRD